MFIQEGWEGLLGIDMRYGRTSIINFVSQATMSVTGFVGTIVLTRYLGKELYGTYVVVISVVAWALIPANLGLNTAVRKRVSEETDGNYVLAGALIQLVLYAVVAGGLLLGADYLNEYMGVNATTVLVLLLGVRLFRGFVTTALDGQHLVHVSSVLQPVEWTSRSVVQVALVVTGLGLTGAFAGYVVGGLLTGAIGLYFVSTRLSLPERSDFEQITSYARFSWLTDIQGRTFLSMDTVILVFFVTNSVIAVYEIAWNLATLFAIFSSSIQNTLFPEMSKLSSSGVDKARISGLLRVSLSYSGLLIIPGLIGSAVVGDVILTIYGEGFDTGYRILLILIVARLLYGYQNQFLNTLSAIDYPELTFRVNAAFVATNLLLNVLLTWQFGWYGAAAATTLSAGVGLLLAYRYASTVLDVVVPVEEIGKQLIAAVGMGAVVYLGRALVHDSLFTIVPLVFLGAGVYVLVLLGLSSEFRTTVINNIRGRDSAAQSE